MVSLDFSASEHILISLLLPSLCMYTVYVNQEQYTLGRNINSHFNSTTAIYLGIRKTSISDAFVPTPLNIPCATTYSSDVINADVLYIHSYQKKLNKKLIWTVAAVKTMRSDN